MPQRPESGASLDTWLGYLEQLHVREIELGLDRVMLVYRKLFRGAMSSRVITVAGTNGKGTTVAALDALLRSQGRHTGTYTSPHLHRYNERICIDGEPASDAGIVAAFEEVEDARGNTSLTYFEFGTLAALVVFRDAAPDDLILEIGLGGRLDAVNIVDPDLAIITTIGVDHVDWLGNDRETIAFEKAGILRPGIPALYGEDDIPKAIIQQARAQRVGLRKLGVEFGWADPGRKQIFYEFEGERRQVLLPVTDIPENSAMNAVQALALLGVDPGQVDLGVLSRLSVPGRFEVIGSEPEIIVDVAHNPHAARWLAERLAVSQTSPGSNTLAVYAGLADKDSLGVIQALKTVVDHWFLAGLIAPRGLSGAELAERVASEIEEHYQVCQTIEEALESALAVARPVDRILLFGSFITVAQARQLV
ncbi:MAG: bifunctional tetrahydrofolate synthase/dihydrofolate synthase [Alteromonadaceae bacterium]|nr:bifunctional tetrahydrofolate synthase/dihydrofolate synthase [Alteromonadaceae bacterium]|tara:strand:- start:1237 stop:2499 length:1263 start_codon:yes stop_codon:yes gene_type:complete